MQCSAGFPGENDHGNGNDPAFAFRTRRFGTGAGFHVSAVPFCAGSTSKHLNDPLELTGNRAARAQGSECCRPFTL